MKKLSLNEMAAVNGGGFGACVASMLGYASNLGLTIVGVATAATGFGGLVAVFGVMGMVASVHSISSNCPMNN